MPTKRISSSLMIIPESVWESSETWKQITSCSHPLWSNFDVAHTAINCDLPLWRQIVAFVRHYQAAPDTDKEAIAKGQIPRSALWVGKSPTELRYQMVSSHLNYLTENDVEGSSQGKGKEKAKARMVRKRLQKQDVTNSEDQYNVGRLSWHKEIGKLVVKWKLNETVDRIIERYGRLPLQLMAARNSRKVIAFLSLI